MKFILKVTLILFSTIFIACDNENTVEKNDFIPLSMGEIEMLGMQHNEALAFTLKSLKLNGASTIRSREQMELLLNQGLRDYYEKSFNSKEAQVANEYSRANVSKYFERAKNKNSARISNISPIEMTIDENKDLLSSEQIILLREIDVALASTNTNIDETIMTLNNIELKVSNLPERDAQVILIAAEIGKSSLSYWNENLDEWAKVLNESNESGRSTDWFSWSDVAGADVAGAVGAGIGAAAINIIVGPGTIAYGAAIIGGAVGNSAVDGVQQVWDYYF